MEDDQLVTLMEKMYVDIQDNLKDMHKKLNELNQSQIKFENDLDIAKKTLYDAYTHNIQGISRIEEKVDGLIAIVDRNDIKLQAMDSERRAL